MLHHHAPGITSAACNGRVRDSCTVATPRPQVSPALLPIRRQPALSHRSKASLAPESESSPFDPSHQSAPQALAFKHPVSFLVLFLLSVYGYLHSTSRLFPAYRHSLLLCLSLALRNRTIATTFDRRPCHATNWRDTLFSYCDRSRRCLDASVTCLLKHIPTFNPPNRDV